MILYKLTDARDQTSNGCQWAENVTVETSGKGDLCGNGWTHWYTHPLLAVLLNPIHANVDLSTAHLWKGDDGGGEVRHNRGLKVGCTKGTTRRRIELTVITPEQNARFAVACALAVYDDAEFRRWAMDSLAGKDQEAKTAARWATNWSTGMDNSRARARAAEAAATAWLAWRASRRWRAAWTAAQAAGWAAQAAGSTDKDPINLVKIAEWATSTEPYQTLATGTNATHPE